VRSAFEICGHRVAPGEKTTVDLPVGSFSNHMPSTLPVRIVHGRKDGPVLFISAAVHGDEVIGVEIIRRLLKSTSLRSVCGTLLCVPVVNTFGFIGHNRYLPDRRDLNRSFPGSPSGSLAGQLAHLFTEEIIKRSDFGIDIHSAAEHRLNLPQIRYFSDDPKTVEMAEVFSAPFVLTAPLRDGSLRMAAQKEGVEVLLYEAGEALRFDETSVRIGVKGILNVMKHLGMIAGSRLKASKTDSVISEESKWVRAPTGGIFRAIRTIGDQAEEGEPLGYICDPFGDDEEVITTKYPGIIIGKSNLPLVNPGDAVFHVAKVSGPKSAEKRITSVGEEIDADPLFDEDEII
jgi:uncharacterized protein